MRVRGGVASSLGRILFALGLPLALLGGLILLIGQSARLDLLNTLAGWGFLVIGVVMMVIGTGLGLWRDLDRRT
jgi:hypothetical protein